MIEQPCTLYKLLLNLKPAFRNKEKIISALIHSFDKAKPTNLLEHRQDNQKKHVKNSRAMSLALCSTISGKVTNTQCGIS